MNEESNQGPSGGAAWLVIAVLIMLALFVATGAGFVASLLGG